MSTLKFDPRLVKMRGAVESDFPFILNSWLKSYRNSSMCKDIPNGVYYKLHGERVKEILFDPSTLVLMMVNSQDVEQIMGYVICNSKAPVLHYIYVKQAFRQYGLGGFLVKAAQAQFPNLATHCTHIARKWAPKAKAFNLVFNPYIGSIIDDSPGITEEALSENLESDEFTPLVQE
jgi:hypothetical protein